MLGFPFRSNRPSSSLISFSPYFRVNSWPDTLPIIQEILDEAARIPGRSNFGWSRSNDRLLWRSTFDDADFMLDNFERFSPMFDRLLAGPALLDRFEFDVPTPDFSRIVQSTNRIARAYDPEFFETLQRFSTTNEPYGYFHKTVSGFGAPDPNKEVSVKPEFAIKDWALAQPLMIDMMNQVTKEPGCTSFSWTKAEDKLQARGTFDSGESMKKYFDDVKVIMEKMDAGPAKLEHLELHGPPPELQKIKDSAAAYNPEYFETQAVIEGGPVGTKAPPPIEGSAEAPNEVIQTATS